jgi:hypothetical protein
MRGRSERKHACQCVHVSASDSIGGRLDRMLTLSLVTVTKDQSYCIYLKIDYANNNK